MCRWSVLQQRDSERMQCSHVFLFVLNSSGSAFGIVRITMAAWLGEDTLVSSVVVQPPPPPPQEGHAPFDYLPFEVAWTVEGGTMFLVLNYHHRIQTLAGGG